MCLEFLPLVQEDPQGQVKCGHHQLSHQQYHHCLEEAFWPEKVGISDALKLPFSETFDHFSQLLLDGELIPDNGSAGSC